jgi:phenylpropionate dioxygenase-like ring-hydroxylating dioxygenase large terminal subunit
MARIDNCSAALRPWWHPMALSAEVSAEPRRVMLLGQAWVLVRFGGRVAAFLDRCPHRGARLSAGEAVGAGSDEALRCAYHGWEFEESGLCRLVPTIGGPPPTPHRCAATVPAAVREVYGIVWMAPESPRAPVLEFAEWYEDGVAVRLLDVRSMATGAAQLIENNFDWSHIPFVHRGTFGVESTLPPAEDVEVGRDGWTLQFAYTSTLGGGRWDPSDSAVHRSWLGAPFTSRLRVEFPDGRVNSWYQAVRPEGLGASRVYQFIASNDLGGGAGVDDADAAFNERILDEDMAILALIDDDGLDLAPDAAPHVPADRASTAYRRLLRDLVAAGEAG